MRLSEAIREFTKWKYIQVSPSTIYGYDGNLRHFCIFIRDKEIEKITLDDVVEWIDWNTKMGFKTSQVEKHSIAIKELLRFYKNRGHNVLDYSLVPLPKRKNISIPRVANDSDYYKLLNSIPASSAYYHIRNRAIIGLLHDTGARVGEIMSLDIDDIDLENNRAFIRTEKDRTDAPFRNIFWRKEVTIYLRTWIIKRKKLLEFLEIEDDKALFISVNGGSKHCRKGSVARRMDITACTNMLRKVSNLAGLKKNINAHSFRHNIGRQLAERGASNSSISQILGHKNISSSEVYTRLFSGQLEKVYHKFFGS